MAHFYPGQFVECVNDDIRAVIQTAWARGDGLEGLRRGRIYTVRFIGQYDGHECVFVEEIRRALDGNGDEPGYAPQRFRPVDESALDVFRAMLEPKQRHEHV